MKTWYSFSAKAELPITEVSIFDEIGMWGISAKQFITDLKAIPANHKILLRIHSPGGEVFDGNAIANALKRHPGGYEAQIEGLAASMATVISLGASPVKMSANAFYMIHNPWGVSLGDAADMREQADLLEKIQVGIVNAYASKSGQSIQQIEEWMDRETWFTAQEAKDAGFVDEVTEAYEIAASANKFARLEKFRNAPCNLTPTENVMNEIEPTSEAVEETPAVELTVVESPTEEPTIEEVAVEETPEAPAEEVPEIPVAFIPNADSILAKFNEVSAERDSFKALADNYKAQLDAERIALDRLERSLGVAAAKIVPAVEPDQPESLCLTRQQFDKLDPLEKDSFFRNGGKLS